MVISIKNIFKHLNTVNTHRYYVFRLCIKCGIPIQGLKHDLSKYSLVEFVPSVKYWTGTRSPISIEIEKTGCSEAWLHHKGRNKHHYEYWLDPIHSTVPYKMPYKYIAEAFCDRTAASKTYLNENYNTAAPLEYMISREKIEKPLFNEASYEELKELFIMLKEKGENETCRYIKTVLKRK